MPSSSQNPPSRGDYSHIPIPTYEEAVSSRPGSSQRNFLGPSEVSHDAERQGLLGRDADGGGGERLGNYRPPTVESARSSLDDIDNLRLSDDEDDARSARASMEELRREMSEMEFEDNGRAGNGRSKWSARGFAEALNFRVNLPRIRLPSRLRAALPSWQAVRSVLPRPPSREALGNLKIDFSVVVRVLALLLIFGMAYLVFFSDMFRVRQRSRHFDPESVRRYVLEQINEGRMRSNLYYITSYDHIAGTEGSYVLGRWIKDEWTNSGLRDVEMERFEVYLNYPKEGGRKVAIVDPPEKQWTATLEEVDNPNNIKQAAVFHGHSRNGNATGPLVYANYGSREDFQKLKDLGIKVEGSMVLMRYGGSEPDRALKVKAAEMNGAVGAITYSDPHDQDEKLTAFAPETLWRFDDAVQRGTVSNMAMVLGDVLSPGFASTPEEKNRMDVNHAKDLGYLPGIPSIPLSMLDAQKLLQSLKGIGKKLYDVAPEWVGEVPYVEWWSGDDKSPKVLLENNNDEVTRQPIYNVIGRIEGDEQSSAKIIVGNHRDAWCFGAVDPGSGTAIMTEIVRVFNLLGRAMWRPSRTIEFVSWDAEEYNMIGSTEHVEKHIEELRQRGIAYINIDAGVFGPELWASASPILEKAFYKAIDRIWDEGQNASVRQLWQDRGTKIGGLGAGSDYAAFQNIAGVSSIDLGMKGSSFPYHSCHDSFSLMDGTFDPNFQHHKVMAQIFALLILELADSPILPFDLEAYGDALAVYLDDIVRYATKAEAQLDFGPLSDSIGIMKQAAKQFHAWEKDWEDMLYANGQFESPVLAAQRVEHNNRAARFEKGLLDLSEGGGLPGREQFKHVVFSPAQWQGYDAAYFAAIREPIEKKDWPAAQAAIKKVSDKITSASNSLLA